MPERAEVRHTLSETQARQLANVTKTVPMMTDISPRWLAAFLQWVPVEAGTYRVNKVVPTKPGSRTVECSPGQEVDLPEIYVDYEEKPREYTLCAVTTVLDLQTRISDMYRSPHDQIKEQLRLIIEKVKERQESELINNNGYGLLHNVDSSMKVKTSMSWRQRCGRSLPSSWRIPGPLRPLAGSAPGAGFRLRRSISSGRLS